MPLPTYDPADYAAQLATKVAHFRDNFAELGVGEPAVFASEPRHYRMRVEFGVWHDGDKLVWADDQEARDIGQAMEDYIEVGLGENIGPGFINSTKMGTVVRWGESGGERFGNFSRRTGMPKSGEDVFVRHNGLFTEAKYLNQAGDVQRGGNLHLRTPQGRDIYAWPDQLWNEIAFKGLMLDTAESLAKAKPRKKC